MSRMTAEGSAVSTTTSAVPADRPDARTRVGTFEIDGSSTRVEVQLRVAGVPVTGSAGAVSGTVQVPADLMSASVSVRVAEPCRGLLPSWLRRSRHTDATTGDVAVFEATRMEPILESFVTHDGDRPLWALVGTLTVGGVTRPTRLAVGVVRTVANGGAVVFSGTATLRCADFGIPRRAGLLGQTVHVRVTGIAHRADG